MPIDLTGPARLLLRSGLRGRTRLTLLLARWFKALQDVSVRDESNARLHLDLRIASSHGLLLGRPGEIVEQALMRHIVHPADVCYDIGAHWGVHTVLLSRLAEAAGRVVAFEPNTEILPLLRKTCRDLENVTLCEIALSDRSGDVELLVPADYSMASLADWTAQSVRRVACRMTTLDEAARRDNLPRPDFVKCDVEGGERDVFAGAGSLFDSAEAPIVLFEVNPRAARAFGVAAGASIELLKALPQPRYQVFAIADDGRLSRLEREPPQLANVLAVPLARMSRIQELLAIHESPLVESH